MPVVEEIRLAAPCPGDGMAYMGDLKSPARKGLRVQVPLRAPTSGHGMGQGRHSPFPGGREAFIRACAAFENPCQPEPYALAGRFHTSAIACSAVHACPSRGLPATVLQAVRRVAAPQVNAAVTALRCPWPSARSATDRESGDEPCPARRRRAFQWQHALYFTASADMLHCHTV